MKFKPKSKRYTKVETIEITDESDGASSDAKKAKNKSFTSWLFDKPLSELPVIYFMIGFCATIANAIFFIMDNETGYIVSGVLGIFITFYGIKHFRTLLNLKKEVDEFSQNNVKFKKERNLLNKEVSRIVAAHQNLKDTAVRIKKVNEKNRENLYQFREISDNMEQFGKKSISELNELSVKSKAVQNRWHQQLFNHERDLLNKVFERMEMEGSRRGMNQKK
eukprot:336541_1